MTGLEKVVSRRRPLLVLAVPMSGTAMPCHAMPCRAFLRPCYTRALSCHTPNCTCHAMPHHTMLALVMHAMPCHAIATPALCYACTPPNLICSAFGLPSGDKPELLYPEAAAELAAMGYGSTLEYVAAAAAAVMRETGLLPHINAGGWPTHG